MPPFSEFSLSRDDRGALLTRARVSIVDMVLHQRMAEFPPAAGLLAAPGSAFVTVRCFANLRGCMGRTDASLSLAETVAQCALSAALHDPRFAPVGPADLRGMEIEISVLSKMTPIAPEAIEPGRHGLLVSRGPLRGLLLPQVAVEHHWSAARFLAETCRKAGLAGGAFHDGETKILAFTADVFSEADFPPGPCAKIEGPA